MRSLPIPISTVKKVIKMALIIFIIGTIVLICFSWWASLKDKRYHGIFRFFAFESILAIIIFNLHNWFIDPFSIKQIISWLLLIASIALVAHGFYLLHKIGKPKTKENAETTTTLVIQGAYKYIRHPLYASLILFAIGAFLKYPTWTGIILVLITVLSLFLTAKVEEQEVIRKFGKDYEMYMEKTKMFIPFLF